MNKMTVSNDMPVVRPLGQNVERFQRRLLSLNYPLVFSRLTDKRLSTFSCVRLDLRQAHN